MRSGFSIVMPVHNEAPVLPYSLPSLYRLDPDQVYLVFDRCQDRSQEIAKHIAEAYKALDKTVFREYNKPDDWNKRVAYLRRLAYMEARYDWILNTDADFILDPRIARHLENLENVALIQFGFLDYPHQAKAFMRQLYSTLTPWKSLAGLYAFNRKAWINSENLAEAKQLDSSEDSHLILSIKENYRTAYIPTKTLNLRSTDTRDRDLQRGRNYAKLVNCSLPRAIATSLAMLRPDFLTGYLAERRRTYE